MHVATSTIKKLVDYCMHTPQDGLSSSASVETLKKLIKHNLEVMRDASEDEKIMEVTDMIQA